MSNTTCSVRDNGPLLVEGPLNLLDGEGKPVAIPTEKKLIALCRCGASSKKPFCDGAHKTAGFESAVRATV